MLRRRGQRNVDRVRQSAVPRPHQCPPGARGTQASDVGGDITGFADGPLSVGLTVNVTAPTKQDGYHRVIARVHDALGPHWVVEADPAAPDD